MITVTRVINERASTADTWMAPYVGYEVKLKTYKDGKQIMILDGERHDVTNYGIESYLSKVHKLTKPD